MGLAKATRLNRIFSHPDGRLLSLAVDHFAGLPLYTTTDGGYIFRRDSYVVTGEMVGRTAHCSANGQGAGKDSREVQAKRVWLTAVGLAATILVGADDPSAKKTATAGGGPELGKRFPPFPKVRSVVRFPEMSGGICVSCLEDGL